MALVDQLRGALSGLMAMIISNFASTVTWFLPQTYTTSGQVIKSFVPLEGGEGVEVAIFDLSRDRAQRQYGMETKIEVQLLVPEGYALNIGYALEVSAGFHLGDCFMVKEMEHLYAAKVWICGAQRIPRSEIHGPLPQ